MGYRTVVMLNNDFSWYSDSDLHKKIHHDMNLGNRTKDSFLASALGQMGRVVECTHADTVTLAKLSFYAEFEPLGYSFWNDKDSGLELLKNVANERGYKLVKK